jgi:hypothetical protein
MVVISLLVIDKWVLLLIGRLAPVSKGTVDKYVRKLDGMASKRSMLWHRQTVVKREDLGDLHSALIGLGFLVAVVANLLGLGVISWIDQPAQSLILFPLLGLAAVSWTYLVFHAVFAQIRLIAGRDDWDFTITRSPVVAGVLFVAFLALEVFVLF